MEDASLEPVAVAYYPAADAIVLTFAGSSASVEQQIAHLAGVAATHAVTIDVVAAAELAGFAAVERDVRASGAWRWTESVSPMRTRQPKAMPVAATAEVRYPTLGVTFVSAEDDAALDVFAREPARGRVFRAMPLRVRDRIDAWGAPPPAFPLMRALKANFDPKGLCNPGRFVGGL